jgi:hypothetical protein
VADLFLSNALPVLEWKGEILKSKEKTNALEGPVVVLANHSTAGAAEILAAVLREYRVAVLIGAPTAGRAMEMSAFKLKTGHFLKVATATPKVAEGKWLPAGGVPPDIAVTVAEADEQAYLLDPYKIPNAPAFTSANGAGRSLRPRVTEADLVRIKREGGDLDQGEPKPARAYELPKPVLRDPVLGRALDLLKGLGVIKSSRTM